MFRSACILLVSIAMCAGISAHLSGQVIEASGGTSSLYQAGGGSLSFRLPGYEFTAGAGTVDGHLLEGLRMLKVTPRGTYILGDDRLDFRLPTDIFDTSHYLLLRGIGFSGVRHDLDIVAFAGTTVIDYDSPLFDGAKIANPAGVLFLKKKLNPRWQLFSDTIVGGKITQIEALQWTPRPKMEIAFAAGLGAGQPFAAASLNMARPRFDLQAAFIAAGEQFRRTAAATPLLAEPNRENLLFTFRPAPFLVLTGAHQNFLVPQGSGVADAKSSIDQGSASLHLLGSQLSGTVYHSTYDLSAYGPLSNHAAAFSASRSFLSKYHFAANYLVSKPLHVRSTESFVSTLSETLTSRISVSESLTYSGGRTSANFGGEFLSNFLSFSANYETFYVPAQNSQPFQQVLLLDVKMKLLGHLMLHGASFVDPTGHMRYTADASTVFAREMTPRPRQPVSIGRYVLHGCVVDSEGAAVEGAAVAIDEVPIYTDSYGCFYMRERKARTHTLSVHISEFLLGGNWQITSMPTSITSTTEDKSPDATVIVSVRRVREVSSAPVEAMPSAPGER